MFTTSAQLARILEERRKDREGFYEKEPEGGYYTDDQQKEWEEWASANNP